MTTTDPRAEQYEAAMHEAALTVRRAGANLSALAFEPDREEMPFELHRWTDRYARELPLLRKCPHGGLSQVLTIFGCEPNRAYCAPCAETRARQLYRDARHRTTVDCDFCGVHFERGGVGPVVFNVAAVVVRAAICAGCLVGSPAANT